MCRRMMSVEVHVGMAGSALQWERSSVVRRPGGSRGRGRREVEDDVDTPPRIQVTDISFFAASARPVGASSAQRVRRAGAVGCDEQIEAVERKGPPVVVGEYRGNGHDLLEGASPEQPALQPPPDPVVPEHVSSSTSGPRSGPQPG